MHILQDYIGNEIANNSNGGGDPTRKKIIEISLAPEAMEEFQRRRATYVIKKNTESMSKKKGSNE